MGEYFGVYKKRTGTTCWKTTGQIAHQRSMKSQVAPLITLSNTINVQANHPADLNVNDRHKQKHAIPSKTWWFDCDYNVSVECMNHSIGLWPPTVRPPAMASSWKLLAITIPWLTVVA